MCISNICISVSSGIFKSKQKVEYHHKLYKMAIIKKTTNVDGAGILRNCKTMQAWLPSIKEPEKNNRYGWMPSPSGLPDNVQHLPHSTFTVIFFQFPGPPTSLFPPQDA
jgi:hypothetical protein